MPGGLHPPIEVVLSWPKPNTENPERRPNTMNILAFVFGPITVCLLLARLWIRVFHQRNAGFDDWLMLAATIPTIALTVLFPIAGSHGFDKHVWDIDMIKDAQLLVEARKYILAVECIFCVASGMIKVSILLFYRRLSARIVSKHFRWATLASIGFIVAYSIAFTLAPILGCQPISAFWDQVNAIKLLQGYKYHCFNEGADIFAASLISVIQDFMTALLPTFLYWHLQIPTRQKFALFGIFAIGYGVVVLGGVRVYYSWRTFHDTYDITWSAWDLMLTSMLELHIGAFCANAPALKVFFKHFFHDRLTTDSRSRSPLDLAYRSTGTRISYKWSTVLGMSVLTRITAVLSKTPRSGRQKGYFSQQHGTPSVDVHGGVHVQHEIHITRSPRTSIARGVTTPRRTSVTTTDLIYDQFYEGVELGRYTTGRNSRESSMRSTRVFEGGDITALPPLPTSPMSMKSLLGQRSISTLQGSNATVEKELPTLPQRAAVVAASVGEEERPSTPFPVLKEEEGGLFRWNSRA
ncbi:hypothetical protein ACN47E_007367 [Coniothyrium glycines]